MKIPEITIQQLLEAGVHLGHKTLRWNPKMKKYIFGKRDSIHIMDLTQTLELTKVALEKVKFIIQLLIMEKFYLYQLKNKLLKLLQKLLKEQINILSTIDG